MGATAQVEVTAFVDGVLTDLHLAAQGTAYGSSNRAVAAVYRDGLVEARGTGAATIAVRHGNLEAAVAVRVTAAGGSPAVKVLASSELGLNFLDREFSIFSFHPPSGSLRAQVVRSEAAGKVAILDESQVELRYSPMVDARGSENSTSVRKTDFWKSATAFYGRPIKAGQGLFGLFMPDDAPAPGPQSLARDAAGGWWRAAGIPILATDDATGYNPFPLIRVTAYDLATGEPLAHTDVVLPVAQETECSNCHFTGGMAAPAGTLQWSRDPDLEVQSKWNILLLHDDRIGTNLREIAPVACTRCHYSELLDSAKTGPTPDQANNLALSKALHNFHGRQVDASGNPVFPPDAPASETCFNCHPGARDQSSRGAMHAAGIDCRDCHSGMLQVGGAYPLRPAGSVDGTNDGQPRRPWKDLPLCGSCHTGDALSHLTGPDLVAAPDGIRLKQAYRIGDESASPIKAANKRFSENDRATFHESKGHGGLLCESCHGSPHAEWPVSDPSHNDNVAAQQIQGHAGVLMECGACHEAGSLELSLNGPHGMHNVNDWVWIHREGHFNHGAFYKEGQANRCKVCHGADMKGTVLSRTSADRVYRIEDDIIARLPKGTMVRCDHCHIMPKPDGL